MTRIGRAAHSMSSLLFVCTANMCRSPLAAAMMRRAVASDRTVEVASAGRLPGGSRVPETGIRVGAERGLDLREHVSTQLEPALLGTADVVLTMTREQARDLVAEDAELWPRVFTVKQFARWLAENPVRAEGLTAAWLSEQASDRRGLELIGADDADDVRDPIGKPARVWRAVADDLAAAVDQIAAALGQRVSRPSSL